MVYLSVMKLNSLIIFIILNGFSLGQDKQFNLKIITNEPLSSIFIRNEFLGNGKVDTFILPGLYELKIIRDIELWDSEMFTETINIPINEGVFKEFKFSKKILLETEPANAMVISKHDTLGNTPIFVNENRMDLVLQKENFLTKKVRVIDKNTKIILEPINTTGVTVSFIKSNEFKFLLGSLVTLGTVAAYYKTKADDSFTLYQDTNDEKYLRSTKKFDLISGISFGLLQINFGYLIYSILIE